FMSVGAYTSALLAKNLGVPFELSLLSGAVLAAIVGVAMGYPSLRLRGVYFAMVTVAFVEAIRLIVQIWVSLTRGMSGLSSIPKPSLLGMVLVTKTDQCYLAIGLMVLTLLILYKLEYSRLGLIWKSIGMADNLALSLGVNVAAYKILAFAVGCFFGGVAGAFSALFVFFFFPPSLLFRRAPNFVLYNSGGGRGFFGGRVRGAPFLSWLRKIFRGTAATRQYETIFFSITM